MCSSDLLGGYWCGRERQRRRPQSWLRHLGAPEGGLCFSGGTNYWHGWLWASWACPGALGQRRTERRVRPSVSFIARTVINRWRSRAPGLACGVRRGARCGQRRESEQCTARNPSGRGPRVSQASAEARPQQQAPMNDVSKSDLAETATSPIECQSAERCAADECGLRRMRCNPHPREHPGAALRRPHFWADMSTTPERLPELPSSMVCIMAPPLH